MCVIIALKTNYRIKPWTAVRKILRDSVPGSQRGDNRNIDRGLRRWEPKKNPKSKYRYSEKFYTKVLVCFFLTRS